MDIPGYRERMLEELSDTLLGLKDEQVERAVGAICGARRLFLAGAGRAGLVARAFAMRLVHMGFTCFVVGEVTVPRIEVGDLLILVSNRAETKTSGCYASTAREAGARVLIFTANPEGGIIGTHDIVVELLAPGYWGDTEGRRGSVQIMNNRFEQGTFLTCDYIAKLIQERMEISTDSMYRRHSILE